MKVLSLFDGISCGMVALKRAGIYVERYVAYEIDKYAIQVSQKNHPNVEHCGNVIHGDFTQYRGFDLVIGGFPCTDLSIAKIGRQGLDGEHSSLFWELVRAIAEVKPRFFLVENNASMPAADRDIITKTLGVEPIMINSALVSAQHRKRLYWTNIPGVKQPEDKGLCVADILEQGANITPYAGSARVGTTLCLNSQSGRKGGKAKQPSLQDRIYSDTGKHPAVTSGFIPKVAIRLNPGNVGQSMRIYDVQGKSVCLNANGWGGGAQSGLYKINLPDGKYVIRALTPVERERLQTLPDNYTAGISSAQRNKCLGNGWTADVIAHILKHIKPI